MTELQVGIKHIRDGVERLPIINSDMSVVGVIGTAPDANLTAYPYNTPVYVQSDDTVEIAKLGSTGTIVDAIKGVQAQLLQGGAKMVIVNVDPGPDTDTTIANIIGDSTLMTGIWAFTKSAQDLGVTPRVIVASGWTSQQYTGVDTVAITNRGSGFTSAPTVGFTGGSGTGAAATATISKGVSSVTVGAPGVGYTAATVVFSPPAAGGERATGTVTVSAGAVTGVTVVNKGHGYGDTEVVTATIYGDGTGALATPVMTGVLESVTITNGGKNFVSAPSVTFTGGAGTGAAATATIDKLANGVCAALPTVLSRLYAVGVVSGPTTSRQAWVDWREKLQSDRLIPGPANDVKVLDANGSPVVKPADAYVAGLIVRRDQEFDGRPFHSAANQPIYGIVGVSRTIEFSLTDASVEAQDIYSRNGGTIVKGESGMEQALSEGGFVYWGTDTLSEDTRWQFYHVVRGRDYIELGQIRTLRYYLGRYNITAATIDAVLNTIGDQLSFLAATQDILDYRLGFEPGKNPGSELRKGNLWIKFQAEEPPVLRKLTISSQRYLAALDSLAVQIANQVDALAI